MKAIGLIPRDQLAAAHGAYGEAFGNAVVSTLPPIAADCAAGDLGDAMPLHTLIHVGVALQHT